MWALLRRTIKTLIFQKYIYRSLRGRGCRLIFTNIRITYRFDLASGSGREITRGRGAVIRDMTLVMDAPAKEGATREKPGSTPIDLKQ